MDRLEYFVELYGSLPRAGPGDNPSTRRALAMMPDVPSQPRILDLGCGPGMQTVELLRIPDAAVVALDFLPPMIARVRRAAEEAGVSDRLETVQADMREMDFERESFDVVWSEGALYNLGFATGLARIRELIRPGGYAAVTEPVWLLPDPPREAVAFWEEYPDIDTPAAKLAVVEAAGYDSIGHFVLPPTSWMENYYDPLASRVREYEESWRGIAEAESVLEEARREIAVFKKCGEFYGYAFFIMRRR